MKTTFTNSIWKYFLGVLFISLSFNAQAQNPSVTVSPTGPIVCAGTKLDLTISNLSGPFTYQWSTGATTSSIVITQSGFYRVRVTGTDLNGNQVTVRSNWYPFLVIPPTNAKITPSGPLTICPGETALLVGSGGQFFSSYEWSTGATTRNITVNATGDYTLTVTNSFGGCNNTSNVTVHVEVLDAGFQPTITANGPITVCKPGYVHLSADPGFTGYLWSTGATTQNVNILMDGLQQGAVLDTLTVYLTVQINNTCEFTNPNGLLVRSVREPKLRPEFCNNFTLSTTDSIRSELVLSYLTAVPQYEFEFEETTQPGITWNYISNTRWCNFANVTPALQAGSFYNVRVRAIIGGTPYCYGSLCQIGIPPTNRIGSSITQNLRNDGSSFASSVFPNPSNESFKLVLSNLNADQSTTVRISDVSGRLMNEYQYDATSGYLQFGEELSNGIYFVSVEQGEAKSVTRVVKTN